MYKDTLRDIIKEIEKWCKENDVAIFYGNITENVATEVSWMKESNTDWKKYLAILKQKNTNILILEIDENVVELDEEEINEYGQLLNEEELEQFNEELDVILKTKNQVAYINLSFIQDSVCYIYDQYSDWYNEYKSILEIFYDEDEEIDNEVNRPQITIFSDDRIEELANKITKNSQYLKCKTKPQRREVLKSLLSKEISRSEFLNNIYYVNLKAEIIYDTEIRLKQEEEIRNKVLSLKNKQLNISQISSKLFLSRDIVRKYYSQDSSD